MTCENVNVPSGRPFTENIELQCVSSARTPQTLYWSKPIILIPLIVILVFLNFL